MQQIFIIPRSYIHLEQSASGPCTLQEERTLYLSSVTPVYLRVVYQ